MRTGADYRNSLRDGRQVFILGEGPVEDVTTHPATQAMVEEYAAWYDRHADPATAEAATQKAADALWGFLDGMAREAGITCAH